MKKSVESSIWGTSKFLCREMKYINSYFQKSIAYISVEKVLDLILSEMESPGEVSAPPVSALWI